MMFQIFKPSSVFLCIVLVFAAYFDNVANSDNIPDIRKKPYKHWRLKIQCQVCNEAVKHYAREAKKLKSKIGKKSITDRDYEQLADRVCNPYKEEGAWITQYDLVKEPPKLSLVNMGDFGKCHRECETVAYSCTKVLSNSVPEILDVIKSNDGKIDGKELKQVLCETPCEKERHDVMTTSKIGSEEWVEADAQHMSMMRMLVDKYEEEAGQSVGGYSMDELNRMVEQQELQKQHETDMKEKRCKRRKRLYGDDYDCDELETEGDGSASPTDSLHDSEEEVELRDDDDDDGDIPTNDKGDINHEEL